MIVTENDAPVQCSDSTQAPVPTATDECAEVIKKANETITELSVKYREAEDSSAAAFAALNLTSQIHRSLRVAGIKSSESASEIEETVGTAEASLIGRKKRQADKLTNILTTFTLIPQASTCSNFQLAYAQFLSYMANISDETISKIVNHQARLENIIKNGIPCTAQEKYSLYRNIDSSAYASAMDAVYTYGKNKKRSMEQYRDERGIQNSLIEDCASTSSPSTSTIIYYY